MLKPKANDLLPEWDVIARSVGLREEKTLDVLHKIVEFLAKPDTSASLGEVMGDTFVPVLKAAPREFALVTLFAHASLVFPVASTVVRPLLKEPDAIRALDADYLEEDFCALFDPLAPFFAGANQHECEFCGITATSWHAVAIRFVADWLRAMKKGYEQAIEASQSDERVEEIAELIHDRGLGLADQAAAKQTAGRIVVMLTQFVTHIEQSKVDESDDLLRLSLRMQQELPRAWLLKYGSGAHDFLRLDDDLLSAVEACMPKGRRCASRNSHFLGWKDKEGLGPAAIRDKWNAMTHEERKGIAPEAAGKVGRSAVKKAIEREEDRRRRRKV